MITGALITAFITWSYTFKRNDEKKWIPRIWTKIPITQVNSTLLAWNNPQRRLNYKLHCLSLACFHFQLYNFNFFNWAPQPPSCFQCSTFVHLHLICGVHQNNAILLTLSFQKKQKFLSFCVFAITSSHSLFPLLQGSAAIKSWIDSLGLEAWVASNNSEYERQHLVWVWLGNIGG